MREETCSRLCSCSLSENCVVFVGGESVTSTASIEASSSLNKAVSQARFSQSRLAQSRAFLSRTTRRCRTVISFTCESICPALSSCCGVFASNDSLICQTYLLASSGVGLHYVLLPLEPCERCCSYNYMFLSVLLSFVDVFLP